MSDEVFQFKKIGEMDSSFIERDFIKIDHQQRAQINDENQSINFFFGEEISKHKKEMVMLSLK